MSELNLPEVPPELVRSRTVILVAAHRSFDSRTDILGYPLFSQVGHGLGRNP
ncbi:hypothetical protein ACFXON_24500 [Bacillus subtilis]